MSKWLTLAIIGGLLGACQPATTAPLPTLARLPSATPIPSATMTQPPASVPTQTTLAPSATITDTPFLTIASPTSTRTLTPTNTPQALAPTPTREILPTQFTFGKSASGLDLAGYRVGTGDAVILLVGGVHAGFESNTIQLVRRLYEHTQANPQDIPTHITLVFVPVLNADGIGAGRTLQGRFNANGVDLNRNWGCGWSQEAYFNEGRVNSGATPFSEPETQALGALIQRVRPSVVLFYHAAARGVFAGNCGANISQPLAEVYGQAVGYPYESAFTKYPITGTAPSWVDSIGIPAVDVELASADDIHFVANWRAIRAVMAWLAE